MESVITFENYRCFSGRSLAKFKLRDGTTALIGTNNSGKSTLLRFFYEARPFFKAMNALDAHALAALKGTPQPLNFVGVTDYHELFYNGNDDPIRVTFELHATGSDDLPTDTPTSLSLVID